MACRKMNEEDAYARNTESGCKTNEGSWDILTGLGGINTCIIIYKKKEEAKLPCSVLCHKNIIMSFTYIYYMANVF